MIFPLEVLARMLSGRLPEYVGMVSDIDPIEPVLALMRMGFSPGFLPVAAVVVAVVVGVGAVEVG